MIYFYLLNFVLPIVFVLIFFALRSLSKGLSGIIALIGLIFLFSLPFLNTSGLYEVFFEIVP